MNNYKSILPLFMHDVYDFHKILTIFDKFTNNSRKPFHNPNLPEKRKNIYELDFIIDD